MKTSSEPKTRQMLLLTAAMLIPFVILSALLIQPLLAYNYGTSIILKTVPVDPRDAFYGDYVNLNFEIAETPVYMLPDQARHHDYDKDGPLTLYLKMRRNGHYDIIDSIVVKKPSSGEKYLKAQLNYYTPSETIDPSYAEDKTATVMLDIGLDSYYSSKEKAKLYSELNNNRLLAAKIRTFDGFAIITQLVTFPSE